MVGVGRPTFALLLLPTRTDLRVQTLVVNERNCAVDTLQALHGLLLADNVQYALQQFWDCFCAGISSSWEPLV